MVRIQNFNKNLQNRRIQMGVLETAMLKGVRSCSIEVAKWGLRRKMYKDIIAQETKLTLDEIDRLEKGEDIDKEDDDE